MRCVVQRVKEASVTVAGETVGKIGPGYMVLIGVSVEDTEKDVRYMADKVPNLRIFEDAEDKMNLSLKDSRELFDTMVEGTRAYLGEYK